MAEFDYKKYIEQVMASTSMDDCPKVPLPKINEDQNYIFISYSHRDYKQVFSDLALMYSKGVRFWYDYDLVAGKKWNKEAFQKIRDAHCSGVIFYLSENLFLSQSVIQEIRITLGLDDDNQAVDKAVNYFSVNLTELSPSEIIFKARASMSDEEWRARGYDSDWTLTLLTAFRDKETYVKFNATDHEEMLITQIQKNFNVMDSFDVVSGEYEGEMLNGKRHGYGVAKYENGTVYEGYWEDNKPHGQGKYTYGESSKSESFEGNFVKGVIQGHGIFKLRSGTVYEGNFTDGKTTGDFTVKYDNGEVYVGQLVNSIRHGKGKITYNANDKRDYYEGDWDNGNRHGEGTLVWKSGEKYVGQWGSNVLNGKGRREYSENSTWLYYEGEHKNDKREGFGKMEYKDGTSWEGTWKADSRVEGQGTVRYDNGFIYTGALMDGKRNGFGKGVDKNGRIYEGTWKDNKWDGTGKVIYEEGNNWLSYEGEVKEDKITGKGIITYSGSSQMSTYEGELLESKRHGHGILHWKDGARFEGEWENDSWEGKGRIDYEATNDWCYFDGEYKKDLRDGYGEVQYRNGESWKGIWKEGSRFEGEGTIKYDDGRVYTGSYSDGMRNGFGKCTYKNGKVYEGQWKNNLFDGQGTLIYEKNPNVEKYVGGFKGGKREGFGILNFTDGGVYEGQWKDDVRHGYGESTYAVNSGLYKAHRGLWFNNEKKGYGEYEMLDGSKRTGYFTDDYLNGPGTIISKKGRVKRVRWKNGALDFTSNKFLSFLWRSNNDQLGYTGEFKDGLYHGQGRYYDVNGSSYEGQWQEGKFHGKGKMIDKDGNIFEGDFVQGKMTGKIVANIFGWLYEGDCVDDHMHGYGALSYMGMTYKGKFNQDVPVGEGTVTDMSGDVYKFNGKECITENAPDKINDFFKDYKKML